jgi:hypothetical protein
MVKGKKVEEKNYIIFAFIVVITFALLFIIKGCYKAYKDHQLKIPIILDYVNEIKYEELNNYLVETPDFVLYTCVPHEKECREFEKKFKDVIKEHNLKDKIVYLNLDSVSEDELSKEKDERILMAFSDSTYFNDYPKVGIFNDGVLLEDILITDKVGVDSVVQLLEEYEIIIEE